MDKQQFGRFPQTNPKPKIQYNLGKTFIPEKKISDDLINSLFLIVSEGNYIKIKDFLLVNHSSTIVKNSNGESVLHLVIKNSNISKNDKLELVKLCIEKGAQINSYDENNITPLHLACQYQLKNIVELLLKNGANPKSSDNQYKTPLHYAIVGESTSCNISTKTKSLIPPTSIKTSGTSKKERNQNTNKFTSVIHNFLNESVTQNYLKQIYNSITDVENMFPYEFANIKNKIKNQIVQIFTDISIPDKEKKIKLNQTLSNTKKSISEFIIQKIGTSLSAVPIEPHTANGWSPDGDSYSINSVLQYSSINDYLNPIKQQIDKDLKNLIINKLLSTINKLNNNINELVAYNTNVNDLIKSYHLYLKCYGKFIANPDIENMDLMDIKISLFNTIDPDELTKGFELPFVDKSFNLNMQTNVATLKDSTNTDVSLTGYIKTLYTLDDNLFKSVSEVNDIDYAMLATIKYILNKSASGSSIDGAVYNSLSTPENIIKFIDKYTKKNPSYQSELSTSFDTILPPTSFEVKRKDGDLPITNPDGSPGSVNFNQGIYFNSKSIILCDIIKQTSSEISQLSVDFLSTPDKSDYKKLYESTIPRLYIQLLNICFIFSYAHDSVSNIKQQLEKMKLVIINLRARLGNDAVSNMFKFFLTYVENNINNQIKESKNIFDKFESSYQLINTLANTLNSIISTIELNCAYVCLSVFHNTDYSSNDIDINNIKNIFYKPLGQLTNLPANFNEFNELLIPGNMPASKKNVIEKLAPKITYFNYPVYITDSEVKAKVGFIGFDATKHESPINNIHNIVPKIDEMKSDIDIAKDDKIDGPTGNLIGNICLHQIAKLNKSDKTYPIIGKYLSNHLGLLKYFVIKHILTIIYDSARNAGANPELKKAIDNILSNIKEVVYINDNDYSFLLTMGGKYIDSVLTEYMQNTINKHSNYILNKLASSNSVDPVLLNSVLTMVTSGTGDPSIDPIIAISKPTGNSNFSLTLDEVNEKLLSYYEDINSVSDDFLKKSDPFLLISDTMLGENTKSTSKIQKILNFNFGISSLENACYSVDVDIIKVLINSGADLNAKDNLGNTVLYYAIEMNNINLIDEILTRHSFNSDTCKNRLGKSPLDVCLDMYSSLINNILDNKFETCDEITKQCIIEFKKNTKYSNNIFKNTSILLPMSLYLLDHHFYIIAKGYPKKWTYELAMEFENNVNIKTKSKYIPLLDSNIYKDIYRLDFPTEQINLLKDKIKLLQDKLTDVTSQKTSINKELAAIESKADKTEYDNYRSDELRSLLDIVTIKERKLTEHINNITHKLNYFDNHKTDKFIDLHEYISKNKEDFKAVYLATSNKNAFKNKHSVVHFYDQIFVNVLNKNTKSDTEPGSVKMLKEKKYSYDVDIKTYPLIWKSYLSQFNIGTNKKDEPVDKIKMTDDYTQILDRTNDYQKKIINDNTLSIKDKVEKISQLEPFYSNVVLQFVDDYFNLPKEYNGVNYAMTAVLDIIIHIVKRVICANIFGLIVKTLLKYIMEIYPAKSDEKTMTDVEFKNYQLFVASTVQKIIDNSSDGGSDLMNYIFEKLPAKLVKFILEIFEGPNEGEDDVDRSNNVESSIAYISVLLGSNVSVDLSKGTSLMTNLEQHIYPYCADYVKLFIENIKKIMDNYMRSLKYQSNMLEILKHVYCGDNSLNPDFTKCANNLKKID